MPKLKIAIDPLLKEMHGPEICWTWRLLLSGIGYSWQEVPMDGSPCDIAYATDYRRANPCQLFVQANSSHWEQQLDFCLDEVGHCVNLSYPIYRGESRRETLFSTFDNCLVCARDLIFDVFWLVTGQEERNLPKNRHGHFDLTATVWHQKKVLVKALASCIGKGLEKTFMNLAFPTPIPRWPAGKQAAACVSHDVDYPEVVRWIEPLRIILRQRHRGFFPAIAVLAGRRHHWHFPSWVQMEQCMNTRSAFYFVAKKGSLLKYAAGIPDPFYDVQSERFMELFRNLTDKGFEIGLHASYQAHESREKFALEKDILEEASGQKIWGNRHHYWNLGKDSFESTLLIHELVGLKYDSSLTHEPYVGWRRGLSWPFFPFHQGKRRELNTLQISTAWMDDHLFGYKENNPGDRLEILYSLADTAAEQGGCLMIDVHDYVFDEALFPQWKKTYQRLWEYIQERSEFWVDTPAQIVEHWTKRYDTIKAESQGLTGMMNCL